MNPTEQKQRRAQKAAPTVSGAQVPEYMEHLIPHRHTDAGVEEFNAGKEPARVQVTSDPLDKAIERHADADPLQPWELTDPMQHLIDKHIQPGQRPYFQAPAVQQRQGDRGFKPVVDERGDPVKLGELVLTQMPEERARKRDKHFRDLGMEVIRANVEKTTIEAEKIARDSEGMITPLMSSSDFGDGFRSISIDPQGRISGEAVPRGTVQFGLHATRGDTTEGA